MRACARMWFVSFVSLVLCHFDHVACSILMPYQIHFACIVYCFLMIDGKSVLSIVSVMIDGKICIVNSFCKAIMASLLFVHVCV